MHQKLTTNLYTINEILNSGISHFDIKSYQRGYRWDIDDVITLINDIKESNNVYCMQPLVVSKLEDNRYEVIDGQQRLTTFKILLNTLSKYIGSNNIDLYEITYETRSCATFLTKMYDGEYAYKVDRLKTENVLELWETLELRPDEINRDNFHLFQSYCTCHYELSKMDIKTIQLIKEKIDSLVKFIWYEVDLKKLNTTAEKLFININKNKIKLTGADLIKALFILDIENEIGISLDVKHLQKQKLANEWDEIEQALQNADFWFFITNYKEQHYDVRIGKMFDLITHNNLESDLGSYFKMNADKSLRNWGAVYQQFRIASEWYDDIYLYHRIGFLVNMGIKPFDKVLKEYKSEKTKSKTDFKNWLELEIKNYLKPLNLEEINYEKNSGRYGHCTGVLLLYNILLIEKYYPHQRFSFGDFTEQEWSLEHIQPQNPKVKNASSWLAWMSEIENILFDNEEDKNNGIITLDSTQYKDPKLDFKKLVEDLRGLVDQTIPREISYLLDILQEKFKEEYETHNIQNLVLLDRVTNSRLSNGTFKEKRSSILQINNLKNIDSKKVFLPLGTLHVFSKAMIFDQSHIQLEYWSSNDGQTYFNEIKQLLSPYTND